MIEIYEFIILDTDARANYLWEHGVYLMARETEVFKINLYKLNTFYVEVYYNIINNEIVGLKPFKSIEPLSPYLDLININTF